MSTDEEINQLRKDRDLAAEGVRYLAREKKRLLVEVSELRSENKRLAERLAELEEHAKQVSFAVGMCEVVDEEVGPIGPSAPGDVLAEVRRLFAREAELSAPPVVPAGCSVRRCTDEHGFYWDLFCGPVDSNDLTWAKHRLAGYRALVWAIEHDERPPHAEDVSNGGDVVSEKDEVV